MGETYRTFYSEGFPEDDIKLLTGSAAYARFPSAPGYLFRLIAHSTNIGSFYLGTRTGTTPFPLELDAGFDTGWFKVSTNNLNRFYFYNPSGSSELLTYWWQW